MKNPKYFFLATGQTHAIKVYAESAEQVKEIILESGIAGDWSNMEVVSIPPLRHLSKDIWEDNMGAPTQPPTPAQGGLFK